MATDDVLIKYKADITDLQAKVALIEKEMSKVPKAVDKAGSGFRNLGSAIAPIGAAIAAAFSVQAIIAFGKESVHAFQEAELSAKKLQTAVSVSGGLQEDFEGLLNQSKQLQEISIFSDEAIQNAQTAALQFGLTAGEVKAILPIVADFASATGQDLNTALSSVLRGIEGQGRGLKLYGINVDAAASRAQNLGSITDQLSSKFTGQAKIVGETGAGAIARYNNQIDDLKEQLGEKLQPLFLGITEAAVSFTEAIIDTTDAIGFLVDGIRAFSGDATGVMEAQLKKLRTILQNAKVDNEDLVSSFSESWKNLSDAEINDKLSTFTRLLANVQEERKRSTNASKEEKQRMDQDIVTYASASLALRKLIEDRKNLAEAQKLSEASLRKLSTEQLKALQIDLAPKTDNTSKDAIEAITKILEERKKAGAEAAKIQAAENEARKQAQQKADEELLQLTIDNIQDEFEKRREQNEFDFNKFEKDKTDQFNQGLITQQQRNDLVKEQLRKFNLEKEKIDTEETAKKSDTDLKDALSKIDRETTAEITKLQQAFNRKGIFTTDAQKKLDEDIEQAELAGLKKRLDAVEKAGGDVTDIASQIAAKEVAINKRKTEEIIKQEEEVAKKRAAIFEVMQAAFGAFAEGTRTVSDRILGGKIAALEAEKEANAAFVQEQQDGLEEQVDKRLITEGQAEKRSADLKKQRVDSEKKANEELKKLKTEQAIINKTLAIFQATLNLAQAISVALSAAPPPFNAALAAISAALAGVQLAAIIAEPIPKFQLGKSYVERGKNPPGIDTVPALLTEGERIVTEQQNRKHWDLYEAIDKGKLDQYLMRLYVTPALKNQRDKYESEKQKDFASNVGQSIVFNGMTYHDADYIRRKGTRIVNEDSLAKKIAGYMAKELSRQRIYDR